MYRSPEKIELRINVCLLSRRRVKERITIIKLNVDYEIRDTLSDYMEINLILTFPL